MVESSNSEGEGDKFADIRFHMGGLRQRKSEEEEIGKQPRGIRGQFAGWGR